MASRNPHIGKNEYQVILMPTSRPRLRWWRLNTCSLESKSFDSFELYVKQRLGTEYP
jgi:hypothetical protein